MNTVRLLPHQARLLQAPFVYPDKRFFMLLAGYGSGKTRALVYAVLTYVKMLLGKRELGGANPKILVGSKNITFLAKTWTNDFEVMLQSSGSTYSFDRAKNIITIGNVQIILVALEQPQTIYGYSVCCCFMDELDELDTPTCMEAIKACNERVRQKIDGFRSPFIIMTTTSQGLKGMYQTYLHFKNNNIGFVLMRARTQDNTFNDKSYIESMYSLYKGKALECYLEGKFVSVDSGLVFPAYDPAVNDLDVDLWDKLEELNINEIFISQDFNCVSGDTLIETLDGQKKIKNLNIGDYVLTRKGYRRVLTKVCKGIKMVQEFNNGLVATPDHVAITPQGEIQLCKAQEFYCLTMPNTRLIKDTREGLKSLFKLKKLVLEATCSDVCKLNQLVAHTIFGVQQNDTTDYIKQFLRLTTERYQKDMLSITKTVSMITDLKTLKYCLMHNTSKNTYKNRVVCTAKRLKSVLQNITPLMMEEERMDVYLKLLGKRTGILVQLYVLTVASLYYQELKQSNVVMNVEKSTERLISEKALNVLRDFVKSAELRLQEQVQRLTVQSIKPIGSVQNGKTKGLQKVYDITVDDAHEFFANGILVHNCFGYAAVACAVIKGAIVIVKDYEIEEMRKAPYIFRYDFPTQKIIWIPDATYKDHYTEFKKELRENDITIAYRKSNPLVQDRNFAINRLLTVPRMFICPIAERMKNAFMTHQIDAKTGAPMKAGKGAPDHWSDCLGYATHYLLCWHKSLKDVYKYTLGQRYDRRGTDTALLEKDALLLPASQLRRVVPEKLEVDTE